MYVFEKNGTLKKKKFFFLQLYCLFGFFSMGNLGCFPWWRRARRPRSGYSKGLQHNNEDQALQKQRFKHSFIWSRILGDDQDHQSQTRSFPEQMPMQDSQHLLAQHYFKHRACTGGLPLGLLPKKSRWGVDDGLVYSPMPGCPQMDPDGHRKRGRPTKAWRRTVEKEMKE